MSSAEFTVEITEETPRQFAELSGDWNPLHTDEEYAAKAPLGRPVLHGAFSAGLFSRLAGMHLPGRECLLRSLNLRFVRPIVPPASLVVGGEVIRDDGRIGQVGCSVVDESTGVRYVEGIYEFERHHFEAEGEPEGSGREVRPEPAGTGKGRVLVTGATGALGKALSEALGGRALGTSRSPRDGLLHVPKVERVGEELGGISLDAVVHCAWPRPDNRKLIEVDLPRSVDRQLADPVRQVLGLARALRDHGTEGAMLVLIGSTAAAPGRHNFKNPLYSLSKSLVPQLARILAVELAPHDRRCAAVVFDVIEGGMSEPMNPRVRLMHTDRSPWGRLPTPTEAAQQIRWLLENRSYLASGMTMQLTGGVMP